jgi:hypothetical protein
MKKIIFALAAVLLANWSLGQKQTYNMDGFTEVSFGTPGIAYVKQGNNYRVEIEADDDALDKLEVEVKGDRLVIRTRKGSWNWGGDKVKAWITLPNIDGLSVSGSGELVTQGTIRVSDLDLSVSGSGDLEASIDGGDVDGSISGSGKIMITGNGDKMNLSISGSGKFVGDDFKVAECTARISGSGNAKVYATEEVDASISGSGTVYYKGDPKRKYSKASGSGKLRAL